METINGIQSYETTQQSLELHIIQPGLAGLMDGSVYSLAPLFAAAYATQNSCTTFLVGLATAAGAGISMAFSQVLSDKGKLSGQGNPWKRGFTSGLMPFTGAIGHTLPFLISNFWVAMMISTIVVVIELLSIALVRHMYRQAPLEKTLVQAIAGGAIIFLAGMFMGKG